MVLVPWRWYEELSTFSKEMDQLFDRFFGADAGGQPWQQYPRVTLNETAERIVVNVEVRGFVPADLEIFFQKNFLVIRGERSRRAERKSKEIYAGQCDCGSFLHTIEINRTVRDEAVDAQYRNGILTVILPIEKQESRALRVTIE